MRIIVPFPAGGSNDTLCRIVADKLSARVEPAGDRRQQARRRRQYRRRDRLNAAGDGYTLLCAPPPPLAINHNLYKTLPYDWSKFVPITVLALVPNVITARKDLPGRHRRRS